MSKKNYQNTVIYKIYCKDESITDIYIGSTTNFIKRRSSHKTTCNNEKNKDYNLNVYQFIRNNGGWDNFNMIEIEKFACNNKNEAELREKYYIELSKASLNSKIPSRTKKQYTEDNKKKIAEKNKKYNENNKQKLAEKNKDYREKNKQKLAEKNKDYREKNKQKLAEKRKENYENNKQIILEKNKERYENNKQIILEKKKETIICECGCEVTKVYLNKHIKSQKHQLLMQFKNEPFNNL